MIVVKPGKLPIGKQKQIPASPFPVKRGCQMTGDLKEIRHFGDISPKCLIFFVTN